MLRQVLAGIACLYLTLPFGEGTKCYHCYSSSLKTTILGSTEDQDYGSTFVRCDKNQNKWNSWDCPSQWPVCIIMSATVKDHYEIVRSCGEENFCSKYTPPPGVSLDNCRECNTTLCNDYPRTPDPPVGPGPLFTFNINLQLNLKKYSSADGLDHQ